MNNYIGDLSSKEKGSGARFNAGKPKLDLIPIRVIALSESYHIGIAFDSNHIALESLAKFQEGGDSVDLYDILKELCIQWEDIAAVFDFGRKKYSEWNWARGMNWSVPIGCIARHILFGLMANEELDKESGLSHKGHIGCNVVMLLTYMRNYADGDDRPKELSNGTK